jgi:hypothetical protein
MLHEKAFIKLSIRWPFRDFRKKNVNYRPALSILPACTLSTAQGDRMNADIKNARAFVVPFLP